VFSAKEKAEQLKPKIFIDNYIPGEHIEGWAVATKEIFKINLSESKQQLDLLLTTCRPDVNKAFYNSVYSEDIARYSGFKEKIDVSLDLSKTTVVFEFCDGDHLEIEYNEL
jgi:hypothetical protein